jgi:hypothetical protein
MASAALAGNTGNDQNHKMNDTVAEIDQDVAGRNISGNEGIIFQRTPRIVSRHRGVTSASFDSMLAASECFELPNFYSRRV